MTLSSRQAIPLATFALVLCPLLIYYITTLLFYRRASSKLRGKVPPTVPYYVPGIFHAFSLAKTGPPRYLAQVIKDYGDSAPFFVNAGPQALLVVRMPSQVGKVLTACTATTTTQSQYEAFDKLFGSPKAALDMYSGANISELEDAALQEAHIVLTQKHLTGASLSTSLETYVSILSENLDNKMFQTGSWTQIDDSWSFFQQIITRCTLEFLFGSDLFKQYPGIVRDYWEFTDAVEGFIPGLPRYWVPSAAVPVRERLLRGIEKWLKADHSGTEFARVAEEDLIWDELKGLKFVQERDNVLARLEGMDFSARAAEMLSIIHESNTTVVTAVIWSLVEVLRRPHLAKGLISNVERYSPSHGAAYNIQAIVDSPLIESLLAETSRLRTASIMVHTNDKSLEIDNDWTAPSNTRILIFPHDLSLNTAAWATARPRTIEKPLEEYWAERFLVTDGSRSKASQRGLRNDSGALSFSMDGLESLNLNSSHSVTPFLGHEYARSTRAMTLAVLLHKFELQLCDSDLFDAAVPPVRDMAFGTIRPLEKIALRIRKRSGSTK